MPTDEIDCYMDMFWNIFGQGHRRWSACRHGGALPCCCATTFTTLFTPTLSSSAMPICRCRPYFQHAHYCMIYGHMPMCHVECYIYINMEYVMKLGRHSHNDLWILICQYADVGHTVIVICINPIFQVAQNDTTRIIYLLLLQEITLFPPKMANGRRIG